MNYNIKNTDLLAFAPIREASYHDADFVAGTATREDDGIEDRLFVIMVRWGHQHVVSKYVNGEREWCNGHYFTNYNEAHAFFVTEVLETLSVAAIGKLKKLPGLIKKLNSFLETPNEVHN